MTHASEATAGTRFAEGDFRAGRVLSRTISVLSHRFLTFFIVSFDTSGTQVGWTVGFGGELLLAGNWILGVEGNFYDFGSLKANSGIANFPDHDVDVNMWSVLGRVSYKFGGPSSNSVVARY